MLAACGATAPQVVVFEPLPRGAEPAIYVTAARQKDEIEGALRAAGFHLVGQPVAAQYLLRVTLGVDQRSQACGTMNNVRYALRRAGQTMVEVEAKGWTGTCEPNVFDAASRALRARVVAMIAGEGA